MKNEETKIEFIHLFVSLPTNDVCSLRDISTNVLIHQVKSMIELRVGVPGDLIHLFFMNNELADEKTLQDYKLRHGCILRVRLHKTWLGLFLACSKGDRYEVFQNGVQAMSESETDFDVELWNKLVIKRATFALFMVTHHGYLSLMLELLNSSAADINGCTVFGRTSLHIAAYQGFVGCVSLLLSEGAVSSALDVFGKTPLQLAHVNKHVYCQKRLYLHQTSRNGDEENREKSGDRSEHGRPKTAPHKLMKNFQQTQRRKNTSSCNVTGAVFKSKYSESLPSITTPKDPSISRQNHTNPSSPYDLPLMKNIEPLETQHPELDEELSSIQYPVVILRAQTAPVRREGSEKSSLSSTSRGIRGIDAILRTSQDDVVGEYHNIDESISDINIATLKVSLPREENMPRDFETTRQPEIISGHHDIQIETRVQNPSRKKILGFVVKAEENRNGKQTNGCPESDQQEEKSISNGCLMPEVNQNDEYTAVTDGELDHQDDRLWTPAAYDSVLQQSRTTTPHRKVTSSLSYDEWLEKKRHAAKEARSGRPSSARTNMRSNVGREIDMAAFQKWLEGKKKFRRGSKSETTAEHHRASSGVAFEEWLRQKRRLNGRTLSESQGLNTKKADPRPKQANLGGKSFSEWLAEKRQKPGNEVKTDNKRNRSHSGKTYREWLSDKNKEKQRETDLKEDLAISELQKKALEDEQRRLNPRVKTFDEWFEEKRAQSIIELIQSKNVPDIDTFLNCKTKFPEDAVLVFDMWLMSKNMEELRKEERLHEEMVEKWRRKEQERLQVRRSIMMKLSQAKKEK